jgi:hypothetical protein
MSASEAAAAAPDAQIQEHEAAPPRDPEARSLANMDPAPPAAQSTQSIRAVLRRRAEALLRPDRRFGRAFENLILALIVLSVASVVVEATSGLPAWTRPVFHIEELIVVAVFSAEYLLRLAAARNQLTLVFRSPGTGTDPSAAEGAPGAVSLKPTRRPL